MAGRSVTLKDIYDIVNRLEDKMDDRLSVIEKRVDANETFRERATAVFGIISVGSGAFFSWLWEKIAKS